MRALAMPPLPDAPAVAPAADEESEAASFASLPPPLVRDIFARLPVDMRARAKLVRRDWRDTLTDVSLWTRLDLSRWSGVTCTVNDAALHGASGFARGGLTALNLSRCGNVTDEALLAVVTANAGALRELHVPRVYFLGRRFAAFYNTAVVETLLRAAPLLAAFHAGVSCTAVPLIRTLLRNEPPYAPLRMKSLTFEWANPSRDDEEAVAAISQDLAAHASLRRMTLNDAPLQAPGALDAVVDAALACRVHSCTFDCCRLSSASAPALVRLLGGGALRSLTLYGNGMEQLLDEAAATLLGDALRANTTLTSFSYSADSLFADSAALTALLGALVAHPSVRRLRIHDSDVVDAARSAVAADLVGTLLAANAPALTELNVYGLHGDTLHALLHALPHNTHLRTLRCGSKYTWDGMTDTVACDVLLPAVRANSSLHKLTVQGDGLAHREARALVAARGKAAAAEAR
jgi:hypothetical protein